MWVSMARADETGEREGSRMFWSVKIGRSKNKIGQGKRQLGIVDLKVCGVKD